MCPEHAVALRRPRCALRSCSTPTRAGLARPASLGGLLARCRVCHAELPETRAPATRCLYCGSVSLLTPEHHRTAARLALVEEVRLRDQFRTSVAGATKGGTRLQSEFALAWVGTTLVLTLALVLFALA